MKDLSPGDRPREKLLTHGAAALGDNELLALVLGSGSRDRNALAVANELLAARGGLPGLLRSTVDDLSRATGSATRKRRRCSQPSSSDGGR
jgi:DNA repair protein RadC